MGFMDKVKDTTDKLGAAVSEAAVKVEGKVAETVDKHGEQIDAGVEAAAKFVDQKTKGKYSEKIHAASDKTKGAVGKLGSDDPEPPTPSDGTA